MAEAPRVVDMGDLDGRRYDAVFVSPHLDDVALSCPGALCARRRRDQRVLVAVAFSHANASGPEPDTDYGMRRDEELRAAARGGYDVLWGRFTDAPFRDPPHRDFHEIVWGDGPVDEAIVDELTVWLSEIVALTRPRELTGPLGVGRHIDHRLVYRAVRDVAARLEVETWHYEERPYALVRHAVALRLGELGRSTDVNFDEFWRSFLKAAYVRHHLHGPTRRRCRQRYAAQCSGAGGEEGTSERWHSRLIAVDDCDSIWNVIAAHASQIEAFLGDLKTFRRQCRRYARRIEPVASYLERQWRS